MGYIEGGAGNVYAVVAAWTMAFCSAQTPHSSGAGLRGFQLVPETTDAEAVSSPGCTVVTAAENTLVPDQSAPTCLRRQVERVATTLVISTK